jgi:O-antigen/teichoic acid export membrane protein
MSDMRVGAHGLAGTGLRAGPWRSPRAAVAAAWRRHRELLSNTGSLLAMTGVTSALGFVYWILAARMLSQRAVGYGSAAVSAMTLLGVIGMLGLNTLLIGELPRRTGRAGLMSAALVTSGLASLALGFGFVAIAPHTGVHFANMVGAPGRAAVFAAGVALTSASMVFDQATIGLLRGDLQLRRNIAFAIGKILTLFAAATILHDQFGLGITLSWVTGIALSMALLAIRLWFDGQPVLARPDWGVLRGLGRTAMAHNWLNLALMMPFYLMPVLVTVIVSPSANAAYYVASMLATFLLIVPGHLATVLFAVVAADPKVLASKLRFSLRVSFIIGLPAMAVLILGAHTALGLFGKGYYIATVPLWLMTLGYPAYVPKVLYIAVCRASGRITHAAVVLTVCSSAEIAAAVAGGMAGGLIGLSWALLAVRYGEALFIAPPVIRAACGHGRHRRSV